MPSSRPTPLPTLHWIIGLLRYQDIPILRREGGQITHVTQVVRSKSRNVQWET